MTEVAVTIHDVRKDGYPNMGTLVGQVAFIFDGCLVSGWPLSEEGDDGLRPWEANSDVGRHAAFYGVTKWVLFPKPIWEIEKTHAEGEVA